MLFDRYTVSTLNFQSMSQVGFAFAVTPMLIAEGMTYAVGMGLVGAVAGVARRTASDRDGPARCMKDGNHDRTNVRCPSADKLIVVGSVIAVAVL